MSGDWVTDEARLLAEIRSLLINILSEMEKLATVIEDAAAPYTIPEPEPEHDRPA